MAVVAAPVALLFWPKALAVGAVRDVFWPVAVALAPLAQVSAGRGREVAVACFAHPRRGRSEAVRDAEASGRGCDVTVAFAA